MEAETEKGWILRFEKIIAFLTGEYKKHWLKEPNIKACIAKLDRKIYHKTQEINELENGELSNLFPPGEQPVPDELDQKMEAAYAENFKMMKEWGKHLDMEDRLKTAFTAQKRYIDWKSLYNF